MEKLSALPHIEVDVCVAAHIAFFKIALCYLHVAQDFLNGLHKQRRFVRTGHIRLRNNFDERSAAAVVVDVRMRAFQVQGLADVFF